MVKTHNEVEMEMTELIEKSIKVINETILLDKNYKAVRDDNGNIAIVEIFKENSLRYENFVEDFIKKNNIKYKDTFFDKYVLSKEDLIKLWKEAEKMELTDDERENLKDFSKHDEKNILSEMFESKVKPLDEIVEINDYYLNK